MILDLLPFLASRTIVLASQSPRRVALLKQVGLVFTQRVSGFPEDLDKAAFATPQAYVEENARQKALAVAESMQSAGETFDFIVGSDSVVVLDGAILEKPESEDHAKEMLGRLSGRSSHVTTGVTIVTPNKKSPGSGAAHLSTVTFHETTQVHFADLSPALISAYVKTGEPMDKAGGYGIQGMAAAFIRGVEGCYFNVMGFPLHAFCSQLRLLVGDEAGPGQQAAAAESKA